MTDQQTTNQESSTPVRATSTPASSMRLLVPALIVLSGVAVFVYATRPKPAVYVPGPDEVVKVKTAAEIQKNIETVKASKNIPAGEKGRVLGFLGVELEQAKARESGGTEPPSQSNSLGP